MPQESTSGSPELSGEELAREMGRLNCQAIGVLVVLIIASLVQMIRQGMESRLVLLFVGSILSLGSLFAFPVLVSRPAATDRELISVRLRAMATGFFPYVFGFYLMFYEGFWRGLRLLIREFTITRFVVTVLFLVAGFWVVRSTHRISVIAERVRNREIVIRDDRKT